MTTRFWWIDTADALQELTSVELNPESRGGLPVLSSIGQAASGSVIVDDPDGTLDFAPWHKFFVSEDTIDPGEDPWHELNRIWQGYITDFTVRRGGYRDGPGRVWDLTVLEKNNVLQQRVVKPAHDGNRPAETDIERLDWFLNTGWVAGVIYDDLGYIDTSGPVNLDAHDYTYQFFGDVLADLSNASGKNHFLLYHPEGGGIDPTGHYDLFYAFPDSTFHSSTLRVSDILSDVDDVVTFAPDYGHEWQSDPSRVFDGVVLPYSGGTVYYAGAVDDGEIFRDGIAPAVEVKTATKANALAFREYEEVQEADETIRLTVRLPNTHIALLRPGMRIEVKSSWMPGFSAFRWVRITEHTIQQRVVGRDDLYEVDLVCSPGPETEPAPDYEYTCTTPGTDVNLCTVAFGPIARGSGSFRVQMCVSAYNVYPPNPAQFPRASIEQDDGGSGFLELNFPTGTNPLTCLEGTFTASDNPPHGPTNFTGHVEGRAEVQATDSTWQALTFTWKVWELP